MGAFVVLSSTPSCTIGYADSNVNVTLSGQYAADDCAAAIHPACPMCTPTSPQAFSTVPHGWIVCIGQEDNIDGTVRPFTIRDTGDGILGSSACQDWTG